MTTKRCLMLVAVVLPCVTAANDELQSLIEDEHNQAIRGGNYAGMRYSPLDQIRRDNVQNLEPTRTFSTGVLRGHEGGPLIVGNALHIHTPFPNKVYSTVFALPDSGGRRR